MYFMDDERLREYERFMQHTPHLQAKGLRRHRHSDYGYKATAGTL